MGCEVEFSIALSFQIHLTERPTGLGNRPAGNDACAIALRTLELYVKGCRGTRAETLASSFATNFQPGRGELFIGSGRHPSVSKIPSRINEASEAFKMSGWGSSPDDLLQRDDRQR
jgi:hypothetical protein